MNIACNGDRTAEGVEILLYLFVRIDATPSINSFNNEQTTKKPM